MAREFSADDAKRLIATYQSLSKQADEIARIDSENGKAIEAAFRALTAKGGFNQYLIKSLRHGIPLDVSADFDMLLQSIYVYMSTHSAVERCMNARKEQSQNIGKSIADLQPAISTLRWVFSSSDTKKRAVAAYDQLIDLTGEQYGGKFREAARALEQVPKQTSEMIRGDYQNRRDSYANFSLPFYNRDGHQATLADLETLISAFAKPLEDARRIVEVTAARHQAVEKAAWQMVGAESLALLATVPVEELNTEIKGVRSKTLRDHGYETLADIRAASVWNLTSIPGISEDAALEIKHVTERFVQRAGKGAKIRLNADDKNQASTDLVVAVYSYKQVYQQADQIEKQYDSFVIEANKDINSLSDAADSVRWFFSSLQNKQQTIEAYSWLRDQWANGRLIELGNLISGTRIDESPYAMAAWVDFERNAAEYYTILERIVPKLAGGKDLLYGLPEDIAREIQNEQFFPDGMKTQLRGYQLMGVKYILHQGKVILGDEMGLGKTVQAIATMVSLRNAGSTHFMVVCPASVLVNWCKEIPKHSNLRVIQIYGSNRRAALNEWKRIGGVAVTTYETTAHIRFTETFKYALLTVDEAHYIKNEKAQRTVNVRKVCEHAERVLYMTGTALENRVEEMIALVNHLRPDIAAELTQYAFMAAAPQFRLQAAPVYYRRKREDVISELPELVDKEEWCTMTRIEVANYEASVMRRNLAEIRQLSWNIADLKESSKAQRLKEIVEDAERNGRKIIVFSFFRNTIRQVQQLLPGRCMPPITGDVPVVQRQEIIDQFSDEKTAAGTVLPSQIQAGGTGLNIQAASVVVFCEPQLKPSIEQQAISRAYRMGQARSVLVHHLLCSNSIDERITEMLEHKQDVFNAFADVSAAAEAQKDIEIDGKSLQQMIEEEIERIKGKDKSTDVDQDEADDDLEYVFTHHLDGTDILPASISHAGSDAQKDTSAKQEKIPELAQNEQLKPLSHTTPDDTKASGINSKGSRRPKLPDPTIWQTDITTDLPSEQVTRHVVENTVRTAAEEKPVENQMLADFFADKGCEVIDKRIKGGCLWVVGSERELSAYVKAAEKKFGVLNGKYSVNGARATSYRSAWYTTVQQ